jgi:hypothetical protein
MARIPVSFGLLADLVHFHLMQKQPQSGPIYQAYPVGMGRGTALHIH